MIIIASAGAYYGEYFPMNAEDVLHCDHQDCFKNIKKKKKKKKKKKASRERKMAEEICIDYQSLSNQGGPVKLDSMWQHRLTRLVRDLTCTAYVLPYNFQTKSI